ncbi:cupin domain-containing protein [Maribacter sp. MAR_2009_72]|uniref:cupin domain-containing protein n=1 Tax=Maribacter sp. MAR_2009_72 TaxID=1250050 RepID=UPI00119BAD8B|nr:cupin domain-containing protein [Maribacter sp. MAR_2009_72]TVZ16247.1 Cupin domain-containing protein [Maribacter sp. MAR_2009_72]
MKLVDWNTLPDLGVSHNPDIKKRTLIGKDEIPRLMMYGTATFKSGQRVELHKHDTMYEVFHIQSGKAIFTVSGKEYELGPGMCITIEPGEMHGQNNPFNEDVSWVYFGIATD